MSDHTALIERLNDHAKGPHTSSYVNAPLLREAATALQTLVEERDALRAEKDPTGQWYAAIALVRSTQQERDAAHDRAERLVAERDALAKAVRQVADLGCATTQHYGRADLERCPRCIALAALDAVKEKGE